jgi:hypothetical protein
MQKGKFVRYLLFIVAVLCFASCEYDTITFEDVVIPPDDEITFSESIIPIFNSKCVDCHDGSIKLDLRSDKAYDALISGDYIDTDSPSDSELYKTLVGGHSSASAADRAVILKWIELGAKND